MFDFRHVERIADLEGNKSFQKLKNLRNFQKALYFSG